MIEETRRRGQGDFCSELPAQTPYVAARPSFSRMPDSALPLLSHPHLTCTSRPTLSSFQKPCKEICMNVVLVNVCWVCQAFLPDLSMFLCMGSLTFSPSTHSMGSYSLWGSTTEIGRISAGMVQLHPELHHTNCPTLNSWWAKLWDQGHSEPNKACLVSCGHFWRSFQVICSSTT